MQGNEKSIVSVVGPASEIGKIHQTVTKTKERQRPLQISLNSSGR
jgi:magnesium-transporting ATPase (P-type)